MHLHNLLLAVLCAFCCVIIGQAYPRLIGSAPGRYKKSDLEYSQTDADEDVLELEHLKSNLDFGNADIILNHNLKRQQKDALNLGDILPDLESQLQSANSPSTPMITTTPYTGAPDAEPKNTELGRQPLLMGLPNGGGGKVLQHTTEAAVSAGNPAVPSTITKPFYGAARLAFGQNPEVLPTTFTSTTTTTTTTASKSTSTINNGESSEPVVNSSETETRDQVTAAAPAPSIEIPTSTGQMPLHPMHPHMPEQQQEQEPQQEGELETIADIVDELDTMKSAARRSVPLVMSPKTANGLLRHPDGQYSSFDMAQYVFWTGDEAGVARAVEEFIKHGLMTHESALKFLHDIRLGIEYLQRSYNNRVYGLEELQQNKIKKSYLVPSTTTMPTTTSTTRTTTTTTTTERPVTVTDQKKKQNLKRNVIEQQIRGNFPNAFDNPSSRNKWKELNVAAKSDLTDYDEATGRAKIAEFIYTEYTLEEILYKLAKVMFMQSLANSSDDAQGQLQKLTDFLEREGNLGVIPVSLQKKVLHVLLSALSDTLSEHPELLPAARLNLANPYPYGSMH